MSKLSKRQKQSAELVDKSKNYELSEAVSILKKAPAAKFDEAVDVVYNLGVDPKYADQIVRGTVALPHGTGKTVRVGVFAKGEAADKAKEAGADVVGAEDLVEKVQQGLIDFDKVVATPDMMPQVGKIGKILGPKGLMPNPKMGTVTPNVEKAVQDIKAGTIEFKVEKKGLVHASVGRMSFTEDKLQENIKALTDAVKAAKPSGAKGVYMQRMALSSTMGPGIRVDIASL